MRQLHAVWSLFRDHSLGYEYLSEALWLTIYPKGVAAYASDDFRGILSQLTSSVRGKDYGYCR